jgi:hypothetical protein
MKTEKSSPTNSQPKPKLFIKHLLPYDAVKLNCETRWNLGTLEKYYLGGGHPGTLNATQKLIDLIADAGGKFPAEPGYVVAHDGQMRRGAGTGYIGWKDFGTHAAAIRYLERYFEIGECSPALLLVAPGPEPTRPSQGSGKARRGAAAALITAVSGSSAGVGRSTKDLEGMGFLNLAQWQILNEKKLQDVGDDTEAWKVLIGSERALYAFCLGEQVLYIGKTARSVAKRFVGYRDPGKTQTTNKRCHREIRRLREQQKTVRILVFPDTSQLQWSAFRINLAAGLEDALVAHFDPFLNGKITTSLDDEQQVEGGKI